MRLAYFSPLPPLRSGIADYSEELLPRLACHAEIDLFIDDGFHPACSIANHFNVHNHRRFLSLASRSAYDTVVYQIGNNPQYHAMIYRMALESPGVVVLHEYVLQHLIQGMTLNAGDPEGYVEAMRYCYGRTGTRLARLMVDTGVEVDVWAYPLFERLVDASLGLIVHNDYTRKRVLASRPQAKVFLVKHHLSLRGLPAAQDATSQARSSLGLPQDILIIGAFGHITPQKRIELSLRAFARLREAFPQVLFVVVGEISPYYDLRLPDDLTEGVIFTGRVTIEDFLQYMAAVDFAVNLRYPQAGETSGSLIRLMGLGKPVIVSNVGSFSEYPDDCCVKVDIAEGEGDMLLAMMRALSVDDELRHHIGTNARRYIRAHHSLQQSAQGYADAIEEIIEAPGGPFDPVPPLSKPKEDDVLVDLLTGIAADVVDIGLGEQEDAMLEGLAQTVVGLDMDKDKR